jgi:hypothetical protein
MYGSTDLICGGATAKGLEVFRRLYYGSAKLPFAQALERGILAAIAEYGDHTPIESKQQKGVDRVAKALVAYFQQWHPDLDHLQPYMVAGEPAVEFTFSIPLPVNHPETGEPFLYAGRFDMLALYKGMFVVDDEKTTGQLGPTWASKWNLRGQFTGYVWACHQYGKPVIGAIARGIRFTKGEFSSESFAEVLQMRADWEIQQWYEQLIHDLKRIVRAWEDGWYDQVFDETCAAYGGCPFQRLCKSAEPDNWIAGHYESRNWDPLAKVPYKQPEDRPAEIVQLPEGVFNV